MDTAPFIHSKQAIWYTGFIASTGSPNMAEGIADSETDKYTLEEMTA